MREPVERLAATGGTGSWGEPTETYSVDFTFYCRAITGRGREFVSGARDTEERRVAFLTHYTDRIAAKDRLRWQGDVYEVAAVTRRYTGNELQIDARFVEGMVTVIAGATAPGAVPTLTLTPGPGTLAVSHAIAADNGSPITDYIYEYNAGAGWLVFSDGTSATPGTTITGLAAVSTQVRAKAVNSVGEGPYSEIATATPQAVVQPMTVESLTPADNATGVLEDANLAITLDRAAASGTFELRRTFDDVLIEGFPANTGSATTTINPTANLAYGVEYYVIDNAVVASDGGALTLVKGDWSFTVRALVPGQVTSPTATALTGADLGKVRLAVPTPPAANGSAITGYTWQRDLSTIVTDTASPYDDVGATKGTSHAYRVAAVNGVGTGPWSDPVNATPLGVPDDPALTLTAGVGSMGFAIADPANTGGSAITSRRVEFKLAADESWTLHDADAGTSGTITGLTEGASYNVRASASNTHGASAFDTKTASALFANPSVVSLSPADNATDVAIDTNFVLRMDKEPATGSIVLIVTGGATVQTFTEASWTKADAGGGEWTLTVNPTSDLSNSEDYHLTASITDVNGNVLTITGETTWNITTVAGSSFAMTLDGSPLAATSTDTDYDYYQITSSGDLGVTGSADAEVELVGDGGGGGDADGFNSGNGGGGAGERTGPVVVALTAGTYPIVIGDGGLGGVVGVRTSQPGSGTSAFGLTALGGGAGSGASSASPVGGEGASGGGNRGGRDWINLQFARGSRGSRGTGANPGRCGGGGGGMGGLSPAPFPLDVSNGGDASTFPAPGPGVESLLPGLTVCRGGPGGFAGGPFAAPELNADFAYSGGNGANPGDGGEGAYTRRATDGAQTGGNGHAGHVVIRVPKSGAATIIRLFEAGEPVPTADPYLDPDGFGYGVSPVALPGYAALEAARVPVRGEHVGEAGTLEGRVLNAADDTEIVGWTDLGAVDNGRFDFRIVVPSSLKFHRIEVRMKNFRSGLVKARQRVTWRTTFSVAQLGQSQVRFGWTRAMPSEDMPLDKAFFMRRFRDEGPDLGQSVAWTDSDFPDFSTTNNVAGASPAAITQRLVATTAAAALGVEGTGLPVMAIAGGGAGAASGSLTPLADVTVPTGTAAPDITNAGTITLADTTITGITKGNQPGAYIFLRGSQDVTIDLATVNGISVASAPGPITLTEASPRVVLAISSNVGGGDLLSEAANVQVLDWPWLPKGGEIAYAKFMHGVYLMGDVTAFVYAQAQANVGPALDLTAFAAAQASMRSAMAAVTGQTASEMPMFCTSLGRGSGTVTTEQLDQWQDMRDIQAGSTPGLTGFDPNASPAGLPGLSGEITNFTFAGAWNQHILGTDNTHGTGPSYFYRDAILADVIAEILDITSLGYNPSLFCIASVARDTTNPNTETVVNLNHRSGTDWSLQSFTDAASDDQDFDSPVVLSKLDGLFQVSEDGTTWTDVPGASISKVDGSTIKLTHTDIGSAGTRYVRYAYGAQFGGCVIDNSALLVPLVYTPIGGLAAS